MRYNSPAAETVEGGRRFPTTPMHGIATAQLIDVATEPSSVRYETPATSYVQCKVFSRNPPGNGKGNVKARHAISGVQDPARPYTEQALPTTRRPSTSRPR